MEDKKAKPDYDPVGNPTVEEVARIERVLIAFVQRILCVGCTERPADRVMCPEETCDTHDRVRHCLEGLLT